MTKQVFLATILIAVAGIWVAGCNKETPQQKVSTRETQNSVAAHPGSNEAANPHAGLKSPEMSADTLHEGKVASTMNSAGYTYVEVDEKGKKVWVAVIETKVKKGDQVEFPDSPPMENFHSKTLNRTFEKIIFSPVIKVNGKTQVAAGVPETTKGGNPHAGLKSQEMP
jgi:hypothetical protein